MVMHVLCFSSLWRVAPQNGVILMVGSSYASCSLSCTRACAFAAPRGTSSARRMNGRKPTAAPYLHQVGGMRNFAARLEPGDKIFFRHDRYAHPDRLHTQQVASIRINVAA